ncbi:MAG: BREX system ATP-binding domain-containing protein [Solirubrobacteraceae bacterium]
MRGYVGVTDYGWYRHLHARPHLDEVNFWRPGGASFKVLPPGGLFFFKLKAPHNAIAGFGQFARFERMPLWLAWEVFGEANGVTSERALVERLGRLARGSRRDLRRETAIGCIFVAFPVFFAPDAFKAIRGEYGSGKTFFARWLSARAQQAGFATAEVQISETETPLHRLETVYRRLIERLGTADTPQGALRSVLERWGFALEEDVLATEEVAEDDTAGLARRVDALMEARLAEISREAPAFAAALRPHRAALVAGDPRLAEGILAWVGGSPNVPAAVKRAAGVKGEIDHFGALSFVQGLLAVLRDAGHPGLLLVLDEVETLQRVR